MIDPNLHIDGGVMRLNNLHFSITKVHLPLFNALVGPRDRNLVAGTIGYVAKSIENPIS